MDLKCTCITCQSNTRKIQNIDNEQLRYNNNKTNDDRVITSDLYRTFNIPKRYEHSCK